MPKRLNTFVHVVDRDADGNELHNATFGPDDKLPAWAVKAITNPDVWADGSDDDEEIAVERPRGNASRDAWVEYARSREVAVTDDMDRDAIKAAVDAAGQ